MAQKCSIPIGDAHWLYAEFPESLHENLNSEPRLELIPKNGDLPHIACTAGSNNEPLPGGELFTPRDIGEGAKTLVHLTLPENISISIEIEDAGARLLRNAHQTARDRIAMEWNQRVKS